MRRILLDLHFGILTRGEMALGYILPKIADTSVWMETKELIRTVYVPVQFWSLRVILTFLDCHSAYLRFTSSHLKLEDRLAVEELL